MNQVTRADGVTAIAMMLIASFAIDRVVVGLLFLLSFLPSWQRVFPEPTLLADPAARARAERKRKLIYFVFAGVLAGLFLAGYGQDRILKAAGFSINPTLDSILTGLILMGGADRMTELLKMIGVQNAEKPAAPARPIEITGRVILEEPAAGKRRLTAEGGVVSVFYPRPDSPEKKPPAPIDVRAKDMVYEEARNQVVYRGEVTMRQGDIVSKSPQATIDLTPDGSRIQTLVAGEPVEVRQGDRQASGTRGTYTPDTETMVLVGEKVMLQEPTRRVEGRSLTFYVGGDRVLVDGREEVRTESVFRRGTPHP